MVVMQGGQPFADAAGLIQREQCAGIDDRCGIEHQRVAVEGHFTQRQAKAIFQQRGQQSWIGKQVREVFACGIMAIQRH